MGTLPLAGVGKHYSRALTERWGKSYLHFLVDSAGWKIPAVDVADLAKGDFPALLRRKLHLTEADTLREALFLLDEAERRLARDPRYPFVFFRRYLGGWHNSDPGPHHVDMVETFVELLQCEQPSRYPNAEMAAAFAVPRGHGKTTCIVSAVIWAICIWDQVPQEMIDEAEAAGEPPPRSVFALFDAFDDPYFFFFGKRHGQAKSNLRKIRKHFERNALLRRDFGSLVGQTWTNEKLTFTNGCTVDSAGIGMAVRGALEDEGGRPNVKIYDDVDDEQALLSEESIQKTEDWLDKVAIPLGIPGESVDFFFGTMLHPNCLLAKVTDREQRPGWGGRIYAALTVGSQPFDEDAEALWPEKMGVGKLKKAYKKSTPKGWACEYMNNPVDDSTSLFPMRWLDRALDRGRRLPMLSGPPARTAEGTWALFDFVVQSFDLAFVEDVKKAEIQRSAWNECVTWGVDFNRQLHIMHVERARGLDPTKLDDWIIMCGFRHEPDFQILEDNHAGHVHVHVVRKHTNIPIIAHHTGANKNHNVEGVPGLQRPFEDDQVTLYCGDAESRKRALNLVQQLHRFPARPNDGVMALWVGWFRIKKMLGKLARVKAAADKRARIEAEIQQLHLDLNRG